MQAELGRLFTPPHLISYQYQSGWDTTCTDWYTGTTLEVVQVAQYPPVGAGWYGLDYTAAVQYQVVPVVNDTLRNSL